MSFFKYGRGIDKNIGHKECPLVPRSSIYSKTTDCNPSYFILNPEEVMLLHNALKKILSNNRLIKKYKEKKYSIYWELEMLFEDISKAKKLKHAVYFTGYN